MILHERRQTSVPDRRRFPRGGQRPGDRPGRHPRVIIADSYSGVRRPCVAYLTHFNFQVEEAERGSSLMDAVLAEGEPPAVVLMDCELADSAVRSGTGIREQSHGIARRRGGSVSIETI